MNSIDPVIYVIFNIINDKCYVGQAFKKNRRLSDHKCSLRLNAHKNNHLQASYNKYGKSAFIFVILENLFDCSTLDEREQYWIDKLQPEYNQAPVAGSCLGFKHSEETKKRWSEQRKGKKRTGEALVNIKEGWKKRGPVSDEAKANMSKSHMGKPAHTQEHKDKLAIRMKGNQHAAGVKQTEDQIEARAKLFRGKPKSAEHIAKISASNKGQKRSVETKLRMSEAAKNKPPVSEETRKKLSEAAKRQWNGS